MTRDDVKNLRQALEIGLADLGSDLGVKLTLGKCIYTETATFELLCCPIQANGVPLDAHQLEWNRNCHRIGMSRDDYGRAFQCGGKRFVIAGWIKRSRNLHVRALSESGAAYKFNAESVRRGLLPREPA